LCSIRPCTFSQCTHLRIWSGLEDLGAATISNSIVDMMKVTKVQLKKVIVNGIAVDMHIHESRRKPVAQVMCSILKGVVCDLKTAVN